MFRDSVCHKAVSKLGFPDGSVSKESACSMGDPGPMPGSGRSTGERNGNPLQYSCQENSMDRVLVIENSQLGCSEAAHLLLWESLEPCILGPASVSTFY